MIDVARVQPLLTSSCASSCQTLTEIKYTFLIKLATEIENITVNVNRGKPENLMSLRHYLCDHMQFSVIFSVNIVGYEKLSK